MTRARKRDAYQEGRRAFTRGLHWNKCPYRYGTPFYAWGRGWTDAWWDSPKGLAEKERLNKLDTQ